jgi:hypothetical protein
MDEYDYPDFDWHIEPSDIYGVDFRKKFVKEFRIEKHLAEDFFLRLEDALPSSMQKAYYRRQFPSEKSIKVAWAAASSTATKLVEDLNKVDEASAFDVATDLGWHMMEHSQKEPPIDYSSQKSIKEVEMEEAMIDRYTSKASEIIATITEFSRLAKELLEELPPSSRGPKKDWELFFWVQGIRTSWEQYLGRKFTRDVDDNGEPISEAARFVTMVTEGTPFEKTKALNMMKKVISRHRKIDIH